MELHSLLALHSVAAIKLTPLVTVESVDTLTHALKVLQRAKLSAVPVFDSCRDNYPGVVDIRTLLRELLKESNIFGEKSPRLLNRSVSFFGEPTPNTVEEKRRVRCLAGPCGKITIYNNFRVILNNSSLLNALEIFGRGGSNILGVAQPGPSVTVVSKQSGVNLAGRAEQEHLKLLTRKEFCTYISELTEVQDALIKLKGKEIAQNGQLLSFPIDTPIQTCVLELAECYTSALALTGERGEFVNMLCLSDCFHFLLQPEHYQSCSAKDYLQEVRPEPFNRKLLFLKNDSARKIFTRMIEHRAFNGWVVSKSQQPIHFINITDILKALYIAVRKRRDTQRVEEAINNRITKNPSTFAGIVKVIFIALAIFKVRDIYNNGYKPKTLPNGKTPWPLPLTFLSKFVSLLVNNV